MNKLNILITGSSGMVGSRFVELYKQKFNLLTPDLPEFDLTDKLAVEKFFTATHPQVVVHFAAFTDVSAAEKQRDDKSGLCWKINVEGTRNLLTSCNPDTYFVLISTDMIFSGSAADPGPYSENHLRSTSSDQITWYGFTKSVSEELVPSSGAVLRLIYPVRSSFSNKLDYLRKPLQLFDSGKLYPLFTDQQISICEIDLACQAIYKIIQNKTPGIFHAASENIGTPYEIISYLIEHFRGVKNAVKPLSIIEFLKTVENPVRYPQFGGLSVLETETKLGIKFGTWQEIIDRLIQQGISF